MWPVASEGEGEHCYQNVNTQCPLYPLMILKYDTPSLYWTPVREKRKASHVMQACPHHVELVHQLLVQRAHLRVHQLLVNGQPHSEDVHLLGGGVSRWVDMRQGNDLANKASCPPPSPRAHLLLHQVLQVRDPLRVFRVAADVVLVEEGLRGRGGEDKRRSRCCGVRRPE